MDSSESSSASTGIDSLTCVLFLTAIVTSYLFVSFNQASYSYAGDYTFIFKKMAIIISTISLGYFTTLCFPLIKQIPKGDILYSGIDGLFSSTVVQTILKYISTVWFIIAIALLPYGHSVINTETHELDDERTEQLKMFYSVFYAIPYYVLFITFSICMVFVVVAFGEISRARSEEDGESMGQILSTSYSGIRSTVGFYFKHDATDAQE
jgi:hypothetical protein